MGGGLLAVTRGHLGQVRGASRWATATLLYALGWVVLGALRGVVPEVISVVVGQGLVLLSLSLYLVILAEFNAVPMRVFWLYALGVAEAVLLTIFTISPDFRVRQIVLSACVSTVALASVRVLLSGRVHRPASHTFTAGMFAFCGTFMAARTLIYLVWETNPSQDAFVLSPMNDISYLVFYVFGAMLTFGFVLMCNDRFCGFWNAGRAPTDR